ncbi:MAG TPA: 2-phosphosulfolactate phosphatase, partial [Terriglobales bacterium]|nr:2-phosphosulfolactate phosphatase [Terriglobales bacterium]
IVLLSSNGTKLITEAKSRAVTYLACLRNFRATAHQLVDTHPRVAIIGAGSRAEFREEDQMCCAWIGELLLQHGYKADNSRTLEMISRWSGAPASALISSKSVDYLRRTDQLRDLEYILEHVDDLRSAYVMYGDEVSQCRRSGVIPVSAREIPAVAKVA